MLTLHNLFALGADLFEPEMPEGAPTKLFGLSVRDMVLLIGVVFLLATILFLWVYANFRQRRDRVGTTSRAVYRAERNSRSESAKQRRKRRRREDAEPIQRNPTLQETGGLPPLRTEEPVEPTQ